MCLWMFKRSRATESPEHYSHKSEFCLIVSFISLLTAEESLASPSNTLDISFLFLVKHADINRIESNNARRVPGVISGNSEYPITVNQFICSEVFLPGQPGLFNG